MRLKSVGESLTVLNSITRVLNLNTSDLRLQEIGLIAIGERYSTTTLKSAISQSTLTKEQIKTILAANGLQGEILETTAAEWANVASTNAVAKSQKIATGSTLGLSNAFKGLSASIKSFAKSHPIILAVSAALASMYGIYKGVNFVQTIADGTYAIEKYNKSLEESEKRIDDNTSSIQEFQDELDTNNSKIKELQTLYNNGKITEAQISELNNLKYQNSLLNEKISKLQKINEEEIRNQALTSVDKFNTEFGSNSQISYDNFIKDSIGDPINGFDEPNEILMIEGMSSNTAVDQLNTLRYFTDKYNECLKNLVNGVEGITQEDVNYYAELLEMAKEKFSAISESLWNDLQDQKSKLEAVRNADGSFENESERIAYENILTWEDIFKGYVDIYKAAANKLNETTENIRKDLNDISFNDPSEFFEVTEKDKASKAIFTALREEADLLSTINKEITENGQIGISSMEGIIGKFPEAKKALAQYMSGIISEKELFKELQEIYDEDKNKYIKSVVEKSKQDEQFFNALKTKYPELFNALAENCYVKDLDNWKNLEQAKLDLDNQVRETFAKNWGSYITVVKDSVTGLYSVMSRSSHMSKAVNIKDYDDADWAVLYETEEEYLNARNQMMNDLDGFNDILTKLNDASYDMVKSSIDLSWEKLSEKNNKDSSKDSSKDYDLIERAIQKLEREITNLKKITDDTYSSWNTRNTALLSQIQKITEEISTQEAAARKYMELAESVELSDYYKNLIKSGQMDVITVDDDKLEKQIDRYIEQYDKAIKAQDSVKDLQSTLNELSKTKFDNLVKQFENLESSISHTINMINKKLNLIEEKGYFADSSVYEKLISQYDRQLNLLYDKKDKLTKELAGSGIQEGTEAWEELRKQINSVNEAIIDTIISIEQFGNKLKENEFSKFEYFQDKINRITAESDFYIDLIEKMDKKLVDENGKYTDEGLATIGLHSQNYNTYLKQADEYAQKIEEINKQLADDPYNTVLRNKLEEYTDAQREAILSAYEEKNAIKDVITKSYEEYADSLGKVIDKYKELISTMKDTHDYEKNIREQTENLAKLNKQYLATLGDDSESGRKNIQQLEKDIKDAQEELQETQYDKLVSDTEKLLDDLKSDYEEFMNQRLDDIDGELIKITESLIGEGKDSVTGVLKDLSNKSNMELSEEIQNIWNDPKPVIDLNTNVKDISSNISGTTTAIDNLKTVVENILTKINEIVNSQIKDTETSSGSGNSSVSSPTPPSSNVSSNYSGNSGHVSNNQSSSNTNDWWIHKTDYYPKDQLNKDTSIVDRLKWHDYDASYDARAKYYEKMGLGLSGDYYAGYDQNVAMLDWMKMHGYAKGSRHINKKQIARTQENGPEMIYDKSTGEMFIPVTMEDFVHSLQERSGMGMPTMLEPGDKVYTNEMSERLWQMAKNPMNNPLMEHTVQMPSTSTINSRNSNNMKIEFGDVNINLPNVRNYEDFMKQAQSDKRFAKMVENMALGKAFGANMFDRYTFN